MTRDQATRWLAVLCHLGALVGPLVVPAAVYVLVDRDDHVRRWHAKEAFNFQLLVLVLITPLYLVAFITFVGEVILPSLRSELPTEAFLFPTTIVVVVLTASLIQMLGIVGGVLAGLRAHVGDAWRYPVTLPVLGRRSPAPAPAAPLPSRTASVMAHLAAVTYVGAIVVPLGLRLFHGDREVRRHASQALGFQLLVMPVVFGLTGPYLRPFLDDTAPAWSWWAPLFILLWFATVGLSVAAAIQVNRGRRWRYPVRLPGFGAP